MTFHPGETNVRMADYVIVNKIDAAPSENTQRIIENVRSLNPRAKIILSNLKVSVDHPEFITGKSVLCVEDGPTLTHGGLPTGVAFKVASEFGASKIIDPRDYSVGSLKEVYTRFAHLGKVLPAMGYSEHQMKELEETINRTPCDAVIVGTPINLGGFLEIAKNKARVTYELEETGDLTLEKVLRGFFTSDLRMPAMKVVPSSL